MLKNTKCGRCQASLTGGYQHAPTMSCPLGVPYIRCEACKTLNRTGKLPWSQMTKSQHREVVFAGILNMLSGGILFGAGLLLIPLFAFGDDALEPIAIPAICGAITIGVVISAIRSWLLYKRAIPLIEDAVKREDWDRAPMMN
jgi:hypothetical protein